MAIVVVGQIATRAANNLKQIRRYDRGIILFLVEPRLGGLLVSESATGRVELDERVSAAGMTDGEVASADAMNSKRAWASFSQAFTENAGMLKGHLGA